MVNQIRSYGTGMLDNEFTIEFTQYPQHSDSSAIRPIADMEPLLFSSFLGILVTIKSVPNPRHLLERLQRLMMLTLFALLN